MKPLVEVDGVSVEFSAGGRKFQAVNEVTLAIGKGETLGLVGESGSGKSTLGKAILRLLEPSSGRIRFDGIDLAALSAEELRRLRPRMQIVFQDPNASLNPRMRAIDIVGDGLRIHGRASGSALEDRVAAMLERVGLGRDDLRKYPHQFSGGQRQRLAIARALILEPDLLILDEPVAALDVSIQAQIIDLLRELRAETQLTYLFIAHDMGVVAGFCDRVAVMYLGRIMELGKDVIRHPRHPYSKALMESVPVPDPAAPRRAAPLAGETPSPVDPPSGCVFRTRCPIAVERCAREIPSLDGGSACFFSAP